MLDVIDGFYARFGLGDVTLKLATRPEKASGAPEMWDAAEEALRTALGDRPHELKEGDGAFYGPKIDFHVTDTMGRSWQLGTCQLDFYMPERFDLSLHDAGGRRGAPGDDPPRRHRAPSSASSAS